MFRFTRRFTNPMSTLLLTILLLAGCVVAQPLQEPTANTTLPPQNPAKNDSILVWEGAPLNAETTDACGRLQIDAAGTATIRTCDGDDSTTQSLNETHAQEWATMQSRFAPFDAATANGNVTFNGTGTSGGEAWQWAIGAWAQLVYTELTSDQVSATGPTAMSWFVGEPDSAGLCQHLTVLRYGYAYAEIVPCGGGQTTQQTIGLLTEQELESFLDWHVRLAPVYVENNYLDGVGTEEASAITLDEISAWAEPVYSRLSNAETVTAPAVAFVRDDVLYIQADAPQGDAVAIEDCSDNSCRILYPTWSPDGSRLLYTRQLQVDPYGTAVFIATRDGETQQVADDSAFYRPAAWSPDGTQVVYLRQTERFDETANQGQVRVLEVWSAAVDTNGSVQTAEQRGEIGFGEGCGGGGRSNSALVYEYEGGFDFAYGYAAAIVEWTPADILLYSNNCTSRGVGRFDMVAGEGLDPYAGDLRSLRLNSNGTRWVAIDNTNQIVLGAPDSLDVTTLANVTLAAGTTPELVFFGLVSGQLYYTTLTRTAETVELVDELGAIDTPFIVQPYFDFAQPALYTFDADLNASQLLWEDDGYAYARVTEMADGSVLFSRVEPNDALLEALQAGTATTENLAELLPTADVLQLAQTATTPAAWLDNAQQFTLFNTAVQ